MSPIDVLIPLAAGLLLVIRPAAFLKKSISPEQMVKKSATLRKWGYVLLAVAALRAGFEAVRP